MGVHTMNFKEATDKLFARVDHATLARVLGVSVATVRQARLSASANAYRVAPEGWERAVVCLAEKHASDFRGLAQKLRKR
jgi:hypothetical protein